MTSFNCPFSVRCDSLLAQLVKNLPAVHETLVRFLGWEDPLEKGQATILVFLGFPCGSAGKESACHAGDLGSVPGLGSLTWRRSQQPAPVFLPGEIPQRSLVDYSPWGCKESDMTERLNTAHLD